MSSKWLNLACIVLLAVANVTSDTKVICYYESWAAYQGVTPEQFDASLCTHVNYAFIGLKDDGNLKVNDDNLDIGQGLFYRVTDMKKRNGNLKVLLSVGGAQETQTRLFAQIAADPNKRGAFIGSTTYFLQQFHFDGLDVDWEYPTGADRGNYITLLRELRNTFNSRGWLLTAAVASSPTDGYDVGQLSGLLDFINIMTYDMYGSWSSYTGQNSALFESSVESGWEKANLNLRAAANNWVNAGAPKNKLAVGTAFYGRSFSLSNPNSHGIHAGIVGVGNDGGYVVYSGICRNYNGWTRVWDDEQKNPYRYSGNQWIGYDDKDSIWAKANYIKNNGFFGVMIWPIDGDDVTGACGTKQILLKQINDGIRR